MTAGRRGGATRLLGECPEGRHHKLPDRKLKHYRSEVVASSLGMLSGRREKDYAAETAAQAPTGMEEPPT